MIRKYLNQGYPAYRFPTAVDDFILIDRYFDVDENNDFQPKVQVDFSNQDEFDDYFTSDS